MTTLRSKQQCGQVILDISILHSTVPDEEIREGDYQKIYSDIKARGLLQPIVVIPYTKEGCKYMEFPPPLQLPTEEGTLMVMCGNNRVQVAKELGFTHIEGIVCKDFEEASTWCKRMRRGL